MRTTHPRVRLLAVVLSVSALLAAAGPAQAVKPPPVKVDLLGCLFNGAATVDADTPFLLDLGWAASTLLHEVEFFLSQRTVASINGVPIQHPNRYWRLPQRTFPFPDLPWNMPWDYPVKAMAHGQQITVAYEWILRFPVSDGVDLYPRGPVLAPIGAFPRCVITAE
jgi:hypothetical protein